MTFPTPVDCLGTKPSSVPGILSVQGLTHWNNRMAYIDRRQENAPDGTVAFIGDSQIEGWAVCAASPFADNYGIGADSLRGVLNRLERMTVLNRAGAGVLLVGLADLAYEYAAYGAQWVQPDVDTCVSKLSAWLTGKWVIVKVLPINPSMASPGQTSDNISYLNGRFDHYFGSRTGFVVVDPAGDGFNYTDHTSDGVHPNAAGYAIIGGLVSDALTTLGVQ